MSALLPDQRWRTAARSALLWRRWDQEFVVFDPRSGDIHLLDPLAAEVLRRLDESSATVDELSRELDVSLGHEAELDLAQYVAKLVGEFDKLGLIEPASVDVQSAASG